MLKSADINKIHLRHQAKEQYLSAYVYIDIYSFFQVEKFIIYMFFYARKIQLSGQTQPPLSVPSEVKCKSNNDPHRAFIENVLIKQTQTGQKPPLLLSEDNPQ